MKSHALGDRLLAAAEFVRRGAVFADVGTDHAYLPIFLLESGIIERAICSDINRGPLLNAETDARERGLSGKIEFILADGATEALKLGATDIAICGMGGELIADIIERAPHLKKEGIRLILQPMSKQSTLRRYLAKNGFAVVCEDYSLDSGKYYLCLAAEYNGVRREISDFEAEFGDVGPRASFSEAKLGYFETKIKALRRAADGKRRGGEPSPEEKLLSELIKIMDSGKG